MPDVQLPETVPPDEAVVEVIALMAVVVTVETTGELVNVTSLP